MTPEELAQRQASHELQDELVDAIWAAMRGVICGHDKVAVGAVISALESVKTKCIINVAEEKTIAKIQESKDATIQPG